MAWLRMTDYRLKLSFSQQRAPTVCEAILSFTQFLHAMFECNVQYLSMTLKKILIENFLFKLNGVGGGVGGITFGELVIFSEEFGEE